MSFGNPFSSGNSSEAGVQGLGHSGFEVSLNYVSGLPDPNIVTNPSIKLWFKSLLKRDDTTKEKALHELVQFAADRTNLDELRDDLVLITWVQLYPKLSLSESKTVRLLSHQLQTQLLATLGKSYTKYLKDTIPVMLSGLYDLDSSVSNATLKNIGMALQNNQDKINVLWIMFQDQILNFADQALNKETVDSLSDDRIVPRDEAELKYLRLINATISMIVHLVQVGYKLYADKMNNNIEEYHKLFNYENLWHYLLVNSNTNQQRIYKTLLQLINAVIHLQPELFTQKAWKLISKRLFKSLTFVKKVDPKSTNAVVYSSIVPHILSTLNNLNQKKPAFFQYDKSHKERIIEFLKIGSLNSDSAYYTKLSHFITTASTIFHSDDIETLEKILHHDFQIEVSKNSKLRAGSPFIVQSLIAYFEVLKKFDSLDKFPHTVVDEVIGIQSSVSLQLVDPLAKYLSKEILSTKLAEWSVKDSGNIKTLLSAALRASAPLESALSASLDDLRSRAEEDEEGETFIHHHAFAIFDFVIKNDLTQYSEQVEEFLDELPTFITTLNKDTPIEILKNYSKSKFYNKDTMLEVFDSFFIKFEFIGLKDFVLEKLDTFGHKDELFAESEELQTTLNEQTTQYNFESDNLFKPHLITRDAALSLWDLAKELQKEADYVSYLLKYNSENAELLSYIFLETSILEDALWTSTADGKLQQSVVTLLDDEKIREKYIGLLRTNISKNGYRLEIIEEVSGAIDKFPVLSTQLVSGDLVSQFQTSYGQFIDSRLSIGNPLETNIYLLSTKEGSFQFESLLGIIRYASFIHALGKVETSGDLLLYLLIISEVAQDYEFLNDAVKYPVLPELSSFHSILKQRLFEKFADESYSTLITQFITNSYTTLSELAVSPDNDDEVTSFYKCRLLKKILDHTQSSESISKILELNWDQYIKQEIRSKSSIRSLQFSTLLSTLAPFLSDGKFDHVKNLAGSELIGLRTSEISQTGLNRLTILINLMNFTNDDNDETNAGYPLPPQRFNMIINDLTKWLDSDIAYEEEFGVVRIQLLHLLQIWSVGEFDKTDGFKELTTRVLQDSIALCSMDEVDNGLEVKYWSLKLYLGLKRNNDVLEDEVLKDVENEIMEGYINDQEEFVNQPVSIYNELLGRFMKSVPISKLQPHKDALLKKFIHLTRAELKRPLLNILKELILIEQQDKVIEFELAKEGDDLEQFKIPEELLGLILKAPDFNGLSSVEDDKTLVDYLWCWKTVLFVFKGITLKLRTLYIQQLQNGNDELINKFLDFLSLIIDSDEDKELMNRLEGDHEAFIEYDFEDDIDGIADEVRILSMNVYYTILSSIGSLASSWFNNIKDRGHKMKLEQFTSKFISPSLITNKLLTFEKRLSQLTKDHENLTIKINKVTNEIKCTYLIDEQYLEIIFKVPSNYPLSNVEVSGPSRVGVKETQWKAWLLACQRIVSLQNGEISESLEFFLKNVSFHFKGFEECAICYSILHQDNSLPSKLCGTCKNKFHAGCLYKWFKSSGSNTCPLCRSTFNFK